MSNRNTKTNIDTIVESMQKSKGRFFGLRLKNGESISAQFIHETPSYVFVRDYNRPRVEKNVPNPSAYERKIAKSSLVGITNRGNF
jgi:hypothetical protein